MIDREKVLAVLQKRFPGSTIEERAAAANAIVGLGDEWVDVSAREPEMGYNVSAQCAEICFLADQRRQGTELRILLRRPTRS
jgi:hypothetical protein